MKTPDPAPLNDLELLGLVLLLVTLIWWCWHSFGGKNMGKSGNEPKTEAITSVMRARSAYMLNHSV